MQEMDKSATETSIWMRSFFKTQKNRFSFEDRKERRKDLAQPEFFAPNKQNTEALDRKQEEDEAEGGEGEHHDDEEAEENNFHKEDKEENEEDRQKTR